MRFDPQGLDKGEVEPRYLRPLSIYLLRGFFCGLGFVDVHCRFWEGSGNYAVERHGHRLKLSEENHFGHLQYEPFTRQ